MGEQPAWAPLKELVGDKANLNEFLETFVDFGEQGAGG